MMNKKNSGYSLLGPALKSPQSRILFEFPRTHVVKKKPDKMYRAFSCYVIAAMSEGKNNTFSLLWEIRLYFHAKLFHCFSPPAWPP